MTTLQNFLGLVILITFPVMLFQVAFEILLDKRTGLWNTIGILLCAIGILAMTFK